MKYNYFTIEKEKRVAVVRIHNPPMNFFRMGMVFELSDMFDAFEYDNDVPLYSNNAAAVYFFTGIETKDSLYDPIHDSLSDNYYASENNLIDNVKRWPNGETIYLLWFKPNNKKNYYTPEQLSLVGDVELMYSVKGGRIYILRPLEPTSN